MRPPHTRGAPVVYADAKLGKNFVKRVVAVEGDHIVVRESRITLNGRALALAPRGQLDVTTDQPTPLAVFEETVDGRSYLVARDGASVAHLDADVTVPPGHVFVMGDNRDNSHDSRAHGTVPVSSIVGEVAVVWMSVASDGTVRWERMGSVVR